MGEHEVSEDRTKAHWANICEETGLAMVDELVRSSAFTSAFLTALADQVHLDNVRAGWWTNLRSGEDLHGVDANGQAKRNVGEMLMLVVTEIAEAMEGHRKKLMDDKLPHRPMLKVELIDAIIRILDILGAHDNLAHPAGEIFMEKRDFNARREDHRPENRVKAGGKEC